MHFPILLHEVGTALGVLGVVTRRDDFLSVGAENVDQRFFVVALRGCDECAAGIFGGRESFLPGLLRQGWRKGAARQESSECG